MSAKDRESLLIRALWTLDFEVAVIQFVTFAWFFFGWLLFNLPADPVLGLALLFPQGRILVNLSEQSEKLLYLLVNELTAVVVWALGVGLIHVVFVLRN